MRVRSAAMLFRAYDLHTQLCIQGHSRHIHNTHTIHQRMTQTVFCLDVSACYIMLCYVMICHAMLYYVMLCYDMSCYAMLCYVMLCYVMLCHLMTCYVMLCYVMLCHLMSCYVVLCHAMSCYAMLCDDMWSVNLVGLYGLMHLSNTSCCLGLYLMYKLVVYRGWHVSGRVDPFGTMLCYSIVLSRVPIWYCVAMWCAMWLQTLTPWHVCCCRSCI